MKKKLQGVLRLTLPPKQISSNWRNTFYAIMSIMVLLFSNTINAQTVEFTATTGTSLGAPFQTSTVYKLNDYIYGTTELGVVNLYRVSVAGTTNATAPLASAYTGVVAITNNGVTFTFQSVLGAATQSWTCPAGVTSIEVQAYGAGGAGGAALVNAAGFTTALSPATRYATAGGGGAGSKVTKTISVVPGTTYNVIVGLGGTTTGPTTANGLYGFSGGKSGFSGPDITPLTASGGTGGTGCSTGNTKFNSGGVLGGVYGFSVTSAGSGYTTPVISLGEAGATTAATTAYIAASGVFSFVGAKTQGIGYTSIPTVSVTGGTGAAFLAYANLNSNSTETGVTAVLGASGGTSDGTTSGAGANNVNGVGGGLGRTSTVSGLNGNPATAFGAGGGGATTANFWNTIVIPNAATGGGSGKGGIGGNGKVVINYYTTSTPSVTHCGTSYSPAGSGQTYTESGTYTYVAGYDTATLTLTLIPLPNAGTDTTLRVCTGTTPTTQQLNDAITGEEAGGTWTNDGLVYTYAVTAACGVTDTATVTVIIEAAANAGTDATLTVCTGTTPSESDLFTALTGEDAGGSWSNVGLVHTYTVVATAPCTGTDTATVTVTEQAAPNAGTDGTLTVCIGTTPTSTQLFEALTGEDAGGSWSNVGLVHTYTVVATAPCTGTDTATVTVTEQAAPNAGTNGALSLSASPSDAALFAAITGEDAGGTWTSPPSGFVGEYTYTVNATAPCTGSDTSTVTVTSSSVIPTSPLNLCKGATVASVTGTTSLKFYKDNVTTTQLGSIIKFVTATTYYVTETNSGNESSRVPVTITVNNLPATPSALTSTESGLICKYINSSTPVTFTATATGAISSYIWTAPEGATIDPDGGQASISFEDVSATPGPIGSVTVKIVDANGCVSLPKALVLTTKVPTAPTSLVMTSLDETEHFKGLVSAADATTVPPTPAVYGLFGLNTLTTGIKKVGPYMKTNTEFTLTAPAADTAASYLWTLNGATQLTGGSGRIITVKFNDNALGTIGNLPISVQSVGGCGNSTLRTLILARTLPTAPTALVLTNATQANLIPLAKITKVGPYTGTNIEFTLTGTPFTTQGATATSYAWVLPAGVVCTSPYAAGVTPLTGSTVIATVPTPWTITDYITTTTSTIPVKFSGATGTGDLLLSVYAVNGTGNSVARTLKLARALPTAPTKLVLTDDAISTTTAVTKVGAYTAKTTDLTLTATPFATQGAEATSFSWVLPAGVNVTAGASLFTDNGTTKTWTGTASVLTINLNGIGVGVLSIPLNVYAVNGAGTSALARNLTVTSAVPTSPAITAGAAKFSTCASTTTTYTATAIPGATYTWGIPGGASGESTTNSIVVDFTGVTTAASYAITCIATNGTGPSTLKSLTITKSTAACKLAPEGVSADEFKVSAYPNPSSSDFTIQASRKGATVKVYDMMGRLIEKRQATSNTVQVGSRCATGTYNVIVTQGANTKTLRVIKK